MTLSLGSKDFRNIHEVRKERNEQIQKGLYGDIQKAEGSRGGKVIGHDRNGKPLYEGSKLSTKYGNRTASHFNQHGQVVTKEDGALSPFHHGNVALREEDKNKTSTANNK